MADADVPAVVEAVRDPDVLRYTTVPDPYGESDARHWLRVSRSGLETGTDLATVIVDAQSDAAARRGRAAQHRPGHRPLLGRVLGRRRGPRARRRRSGRSRC